MSIEIKMRKNEPIDRALRRMKKKLERENIIKDVRMKRYAEKPSERRRRKERERIKNLRKAEKGDVKKDKKDKKDKDKDKKDLKKKGRFGREGEGRE
jgi:small subunit ribosomal protein S21